MTRVLAAFLQQESNTFAPTMSSIANFEIGGLLRDEEVISRFAGTGTDWGELIRQSADRDWQLTTALHAHAQPSGVLARNAFDQLCSTIVDAWTGDHSAAFLMLHGSMVADGIFDCEGELLRRLRSRAGAEVPIVVTLDPHANVSALMAEHASAMIAYRTTPHVDQVATTSRAVALLAEMLDRNIVPVTFLARPPTIQGLDAARTISGFGPMIDMLALSDEVEREADIAGVSVHAGFAYADVPDAGPSVAVMSWSGDASHADRAAALAGEIWRTRARRTVEYLSVRDGLAQLGSASHRAGPLIIADPADNPGSGAPGDETAFLEAFLQINPPNSAFYAIVDPDAVLECIAAGVGADIDLQLGTTAAARRRAVPLSVSGVVEAVSDGQYVRQGPYFTGTRATMGKSVLIRIGAVAVIVTSEPLQAEERSQFRLLGLEVAELDVLALKGANHFRADLEEICSGIVFVDGGGVCSPDVLTRTYRNVRRPIWPIDAPILGDPPSEPSTASEAVAGYRRRNAEEVDPCTLPASVVRAPRLA